MNTKGSRSSTWSHSRLIERLKQSLIERETGKKYDIYVSLEEIPEILQKIAQVKKVYKLSIDPNLPIDIIYAEKKEELRKKEFCYYTFFLVVSTKAFPDSLENTIMFYKFYFSRIISSRRFKIVLVVPHDIEEIKMEFFQRNGIGLWEFTRGGKGIEEVLPPICLREQMAKEYQEEKPRDTALFFDKYIHDAVISIAGISPEQFGKRYIDRKMMDKIFDLEKISYRKRLFTLMNEHLTEKGDEYEFAAEVFSKLWEEYIGIPYKDFLEKFDPVLQNVFAQTRKRGRIYRDHYLHQFQVFLLGLYIMDKLYSNFANKYKNPEINWLIISSFHDMAYPIQLYDDWSGEFFREIFAVPKDIAHIDLKSKFVEQSFMNCTNCLITRLCCVFGKEELKDNWLADKNNLVQFFYKKITEGKNHCILSSMSLLKMIEDSKYTSKITIDGMSTEDVLKDIFIPSALAIALHDENVWKDLRIMEKVPLNTLKFEDDPLSFLLIFCDNIQEWGRPSQSKIDDKEEIKKRFYLKDIKYDSTTGFYFTIWTPNHKKTRRFFEKKRIELGKTKTFLQQSSATKFVIRLEDKKHDGEDFEMQGSS